MSTGRSYLMHAQGSPQSDKDKGQVHREGNKGEEYDTCHTGKVRSCRAKVRPVYEEGAGIVAKRQVVRTGPDGSGRAPGHDGYGKEEDRRV